VILIIHQAIGLAEPLIAEIDPIKDFEKGLPIQVIPKNRFPVIHPTGDRINSTGKLYP